MGSVGSSLGARRAARHLGVALLVVFGVLGGACAGAERDSAPTTATAEQPEGAPQPAALSCAPPPAPTPRMNGSTEEFFAQSCELDLCPAEQRFDDCVRDDAFAAYAGDPDALDRAWCRLSQHLETDPEHSEALVWLGGLELFLSGFVFSEGDIQAGLRLQERALGRLDRAVVLSPNAAQVRIPRVTALAATLQYLEPDAREVALEKAESDLAFRWSQVEGQALTVHARGELHALSAQLQAQRVSLTQGQERSAAEAELAARLERMRTELPDTGYAMGAECWLSGERAAPIGCIGCHE